MLNNFSGSGALFMWHTVLDITYMTLGWSPNVGSVFDIAPHSDSLAGPDAVIQDTGV